MRDRRGWGQHGDGEIRPLGAGVLAKLADQVLAADAVLQAEAAFREARTAETAGPALDFFDDNRTRAAERLYRQMGRPGLLKRGRFGIWIWFDPIDQRAVAIVQPILDLDAG